MSRSGEKWIININLPKWIVAIFLTIMLTIGIMKYFDYTADKKCSDYCYEKYPYKRSILPNGQEIKLPASLQDSVALAGYKLPMNEAWLGCYIACREGILDINE